MPIETPVFVVACAGGNSAAASVSNARLFIASSFSLDWGDFDWPHGLRHTIGLDFLCRQDCAGGTAAGERGVTRVQIERHLGVQIGRAGAG